jgi:hypothetical protein
MSDLVITQPQDMSLGRWNATKAWLSGWLESQSMFGSPWSWSVCDDHNLFVFDCDICRENGEEE